ncbi:hypothetical protein D3C80_1525350 [compost metagenome]
MRQHKFIHLDMPEILDMLLLHNLHCRMYLRSNPLNTGNDQQRFAVNQRSLVNTDVTEYNRRSRSADVGLEQNLIA